MRWLGNDLAHKPLGEIERELADLLSTPIQQRSVHDTERIADLRDARRRIRGTRCR